MMRRSLRRLLSLWLVVLLSAGCTDAFSPAASPSPAAVAPSPTPASVPAPRPSVWPTAGWETSTPEQQGMDSDKLADMFAFIQQQQANVHSVLVIRHGALVAEAYFHPYQPDVKQEIASCTKSVTSALVGIAIQQGAIESVDQSVLDFFPDRTVQHLDPRKQELRLEHLLTMTSGLAWNEDPSTADRMVQSGDWVQFILDQPMMVAPGEAFNYSSGNSHLLSAIIQHTSGMSTSAFAQTHLFAPLGITDVSWSTDPAGITVGGAGLAMTPRDMAKFGYLYVRQGVWEGRQVVPKTWVDTSTRTHVTTSDGQGYGYQWWIPRFGGYVARGTGGQRIFVLPAQDLVVIVTGSLNTTQERSLPEALVESFILPAVRSDAPLPENPQGIQQLEAQIRAATEPEVQPVPPFPPTARDVSGKAYALESNELGWQAVMLTFGESEAWLTLIDARIIDVQGQFELPIGLDNRFRITQVPELGQVALRGFWRDDTTFVGEFHIMGYPQRLDLAFTFAGNAVDVVSKGSPGRTIRFHGTARE